ncbi:MAG: RDD family protein [Planctomycetes bacterium]|nr:RDD family protein [Planctomycetota bacterium]
MTLPSLLVRRVAAYALDVVLLFAVCAPCSFLGMWLLDLRPEQGAEIWWALVVTFSIPCWTYFTCSDARGHTFGKRWFGLRVVSEVGGAPPLRQALQRTAWKLLPWETTHAVAFLWPAGWDTFPLSQGTGLAVANLMALGWLAAAAWTGGARSVHDRMAATFVARMQGEAFESGVPELGFTPPDVLDRALVGTWPAQSGAGGGYVWDAVLEYRVWCHPHRGAPDLADGSDWYQPFATWAEARTFALQTPGAEEPLALVLQEERIDEPAPGQYVHVREPRRTEWPVEFLRRPRRTARTIPDFLAPDAPPNRLDILRGLAEP